MIEFRDVTYTYPGALPPVLNHLSMSIEEGEFILVVGPSGAGKSTLLRCLNGLVPHFYGGRFGGQVRVFGNDPLEKEPREMSRVVGFVFQDPETQFVVDTVEGELAFAMENHNLSPLLMRKRVEEVLDQLNIAHLRNREVSTLSGGEKQRVAIASVLTLSPRVLVLDEPTSQLDPQAAEEVLTTLQKLNADLGLTIILSEHRLERVVQYADRILYMPGIGQEPISGSPQKVLQHIDLTPPLITLAKELGWDEIPLTIKAGRKQVRRMPLVAEILSSEIHPSTAGSEQGEAPQSSSPIAMENVWFSYNGHDALRGVSLSVRPGELIALMGRNGSGKTTLLKQILGLLRPKRGTVRVYGLDTSHTDLEQIVSHVGYVPQNPGSLLFAETVREELDFTRLSHKMPEGDYMPLLTKLGLAAHAESYPRDLSVGERQRVALAAILVADPEIILLDEPTRGLDYVQKRSLANLLQKQKAEGHTVLMATHDVELVATCADRVIILGDGEVIVDGPAREVMAGSMVFSSQINKLFRDPRFLTVEDVLHAVGSRKSHS
jgi:energy-coupling factor transport system ATP-binding protein